MGQEKSKYTKIEGFERFERLQPLPEICPDNYIVGAFAYGGAGDFYCQ